MSRSTQFFLLLFLALTCDASRSSEYDLVDTPQPQPTEVPEPAAPEDAREGSEPATPDGCGRGTGRNASGDCEQLRTQDAGYVQRVQLPAGRFVMGYVPRQYDSAIAQHDPRERWGGQPLRSAEVSSFWIDLHEVTRKSYAQCVQSGSCSEAQCPGGVNPVQGHTEQAAESMPQTCVTHQQAGDFCRAHGGRLPTELEWEYAARGVDARLFPWGNAIRDELTAQLLPVAAGANDLSYFGIRSMGSNANEWVAEPYAVDASLAPFLTRPFRRNQGPLMKAERARGTRHVIKGARVGMRQDQGQPAPLVGFRCASDLDPSQTPLTVPVSAPPLSISQKTPGDLLIFGGVAEAVDRREAENFCAALKVQHEAEIEANQWRLPTLEEVKTIGLSFRGPGPFWSAQGAIAQYPAPDSTTKSAAPDDPWSFVKNAQDSDTYAARCVHDLAP